MREAQEPTAGKPTYRHPLAYESLVAATKAILEEAGAQQHVPHGGLKGAAIEALLQKFLSQHLPARFSTCGGLVIAEDGSVSSQTDVIIFDKHNTPLVSVGAPMVPCETVVGAIEVKTTLNTKVMTKAIADCARIKGLTKTRHEAALPAEKGVPPFFQPYAMPFLTHCALLGFFGSEGLDKIARAFHRHYCDVPFGYQLDAIVSLQRGLITLASHHPRPDLPRDAVSAVYCLPPGSDDPKGQSVLLLPDLCAPDWNETRRVRLGPRVPWPIGTLLFVATTECGISALSAWFRLFLGFLAPQLGPQYLPTYGHFTDGLPTGTSTKLTPLAIAVDPNRLEEEKEEYVAKAVVALLDRTVPDHVARRCRRVKDQAKQAAASVSRRA